MRILGVDLASPASDESARESTLVELNEEGRTSRLLRATTLAGVATSVAQLAEGEPFLLGLNVPVVVPPKPSRVRPVERLIRRRLGVGLPPGGRAAAGVEVHGLAGEALLAALAALGHPCLPFPDRSRRRPALVETHPALTLKMLLWESSPLAGAPDPTVREELFCAYAAPTYRGRDARARSSWAERAVQIDLALTCLGPNSGFDLAPAREALSRAATSRDVERAGGALDACLIAGTARRYLEAPESCVFLGDQERGYVVLPADGFVRRLALAGAREPQRPHLFPQASLRQRLGPHARLRPVDLLALPGRPQHTEVSFEEPPRYEFDNVDEMLWWKHCRHLAGPDLPTEGLRELFVALDADPGEAEPSALRLVRSRHRTLSFRFDPPDRWRTRLPTRDGRTHPFRVLRALYETA